MKIVHTRQSDPMMEWMPPASVSRASPESVAAMFSADDLVAQFALARSVAHLPEGWRVRSIAGWSLATHAALSPVVELRTAAGDAIGWMLGLAISEDGSPFSDVTTAPSLQEIDTDDCAFERFVYGHGGRFLAILAAGPRPRVYLDPVGSMSAVYVPALGMVAATPSLVPDVRGLEYNDALIREFSLTTRSGVFPFGLTARRGVHRLLPNFFLDLTSWTTHRHWPHAPIEEDQDPAEAVALTSRILKRHVSALAATYPLRCGLTAGMDTRMMLAHTREYLDRTVFLTRVIPDQSGQLDLAIARVLASRFGLNHQVLPYCEPSERALHQWRFRGGFSLGEMRGWRSSESYAQVGPLRVEMVGLVATLGRCTSYWRKSGYGENPMTPDLMVRVLGEPAMPAVLELAARWLHELPQSRTMTVLDLLFIEQHLGCWGGVLPYAEASYSPLRLYPFTHRDILTAFLRLPDRYRIARRFPTDLIAAQWPELLRVPFNRELGTKYYVRCARRYAWLARRRLGL